MLARLSWSVRVVQQLAHGLMALEGPGRSPHAPPCRVIELPRHLHCARRCKSQIRARRNSRVRAGCRLVEQRPGAAERGRPDQFRQQPGRPPRPTGASVDRRRRPILRMPGPISNVPRHANLNGPRARPVQMARDGLSAPGHGAFKPCKSPAPSWRCSAPADERRACVQKRPIMRRTPGGPSSCCLPSQNPSNNLAEPPEVVRLF